LFAARKPSILGVKAKTKDANSKIEAVYPELSGYGKQKIKFLKNGIYINLIPCNYKFCSTIFLMLFFSAFYVVSTMVE
jgi:hypothetical protein